MQLVGPYTMLMEAVTAGTRHVKLLVYTYVC